MNKVTLFLVAVVAMTMNTIGLGHIPKNNRSRTPNIQGSHRRRQHRPNAPNDGHWHMKFHRGRA